MIISKSNQIQLHYYFSDNSHGFDATVRNECERENLELDNEIKKQELKNLQLKTIKEDEIDGELMKRIVELLVLNYKIIWRRSNFYKKVTNYKRISKVSEQRYNDDKPVGSDREISRSNFTSFILSSDELPKNEIVEAKIDLISPVLKSGKFSWKGFYNNDIISFEMNDITFKKMIQNGEITLNNKVVLNTVLIQDRKIDENGHIKVTKSSVQLVIDYSINNVKYITTEGKDYLS